MAQPSNSTSDAASMPPGTGASLTKARAASGKKTARPSAGWLNRRAAPARASRMVRPPTTDPEHHQFDHVGDVDGVEERCGDVLVSPVSPQRPRRAGTTCKQGRRGRADGRQSRHRAADAYVWTGCQHPQCAADDHTRAVTAAPCTSQEWFTAAVALSASTVLTSAGPACGSALVGRTASPACYAATDTSTEAITARRECVQPRRWPRGPRGRWARPGEPGQHRHNPR